MEMRIDDVHSGAPAAPASGSGRPAILPLLLRPMMIHQFY
jgi:hypothetical protein